MCLSVSEYVGRHNFIQVHFERHDYPHAISGRQSGTVTRKSQSTYVFLPVSFQQHSVFLHLQPVEYKVVQLKDGPFHRSITQRHYIKR